MGGATLDGVQLSRAEGRRKENVELVESDELADVLLVVERLLTQRRDHAPVRLGRADAPASNPRSGERGPRARTNGWR